VEQCCIRSIPAGFGHRIAQTTPCIKWLRLEDQCARHIVLPHGICTVSQAKMPEPPPSGTPAPRIARTWSSISGCHAARARPPQGNEGFLRRKDRSVFPWNWSRSLVQSNLATES
jgi:hypothetical protein